MNNEIKNLEDWINDFSEKAGEMYLPNILNKQALINVKIYSYLIKLEDRIYKLEKELSDE